MSLRKARSSWSRSLTLRIPVSVADPSIGRRRMVGGPASATPGLGVALVGHDPVEPGFETIGVAQCSHLPPGHDEGRLDGILDEVDVTQDPVRNPHASVADQAGEGVEGLLVALLRPVSELSMHSSAPWSLDRP
jgi:hypothetical protein